ncbi:MAG: methyltransferase [Parcubacteria group bacterium]|nr:methyltransferase [Parcubacteria group bacterium]
MLNEYKDGSIWQNNLDGINIRSDLLVSKRVLDLLDSLEDKKVLDVGCGNGKVARILEKKGATVYGVDVVTQQITVARSIPSKITYLVGHMLHLDAINMPKDFDIAISLMTFLYLNEEEFPIALREIKEHLREGGRFIWANIHPSRYVDGAKIEAELPSVDGGSFKTTFYSHSMEFIRKTFEEIGFTINNILEPLPTRSEIEQYPGLFIEENGSPQYLIIDSQV